MKKKDEKESRDSYLRNNLGHFFDDMIGDGVTLTPDEFMLYGNAASWATDSTNASGSTSLMYAGIDKKGTKKKPRE